MLSITIICKPWLIWLKYSGFFDDHNDQHSSFPPIVYTHGKLFQTDGYVVLGCAFI